MIQQDVTITTITDLRGKFPPLLRRRQAIELCERIGCGRRIFEELCRENRPGFRTRLGLGKYHHYSREIIITSLIPS